MAVVYTARTGTGRKWGGLLGETLVPGNTNRCVRCVPLVSGQYPTQASPVPVSGGNCAGQPEVRFAHPCPSGLGATHEGGITFTTTSATVKR